MKREVDGARKSALRNFLMQSRARLRPGDVGIVSVGRRRVPGLRRQEVAQLAGIGVVWYTLLETGSDIRVSPRMLDRLATALRLSDDEKLCLFSLAIDEMPVAHGTVLRSQSHEMLDAFRSMRWLSQKLWTASTEEEALALAREHAMTELRPDVTATRTRIGARQWAYESIGDNDKRGEDVLALLQARWGASILDEIHSYRFMNQPGELVTREEHEVRFPQVATKRRPALHAVGWSDVSWVMASTQSRSGLVARLMAFHNKPHDYSELERALLSTMAELTSLALSAV